MKSLKLTLILLGLTGFAVSQNQPLKEDIEAIKSMCGCYSVTFDYVETFESDTNYKKHEPYHAKATAEWVFVLEETKEKLVLQHLLVVNDTSVVKHWRQDWIYENNDLYEFNTPGKWSYVKLKDKEVVNQWTQKVYQVDDSPRYEGSASWVHVDGNNYWVNTTDAPLPRREFSKRSDYNVMKRTNKHALTNYGWVHEQDNEKVIRTDKGDSVIVQEKGFNRYTKIDKKNCKLAIDWWKDNEAYWELVRIEWQKVFDRKMDLSLQKKVDDKLLWQALFDLNKELANSSEKDPKSVSTKIHNVLDKYVVNGLQFSKI